MFCLSGWISSYLYGAILAKFQPDVLNPLALIRGCLLYLVQVMFTWMRSVNTRFPTSFLAIFKGRSSVITHTLSQGNSQSNPFPHPWVHTSRIRRECPRVSGVGNSGAYSHSFSDKRGTNFFWEQTGRDGVWTNHNRAGEACGGGGGGNWWPGAFISTGNSIFMWVCFGNDLAVALGLHYYFDFRRNYTTL